jgi:siroheme decarboxylase
MKELTEIDKKIIREMQKGLPLCLEPFKVISEKIGIGEDELVNKLNEFKENGLIRRFGARVKHNKAGYKENIMVVWNVPEEKIEETGAIIANYKEVSHCYIRPYLPDFHYNLYSMTHGREEGDCIKIIKEISRRINITDYKMLTTEKEYKKTSPLYFI